MVATYVCFTCVHSVYLVYMGSGKPSRSGQNVFDENLCITVEVLAF